MENKNTALATLPTAQQFMQPSEYTSDQLQLIRDTYANGASEEEFRMLMEIAKTRKLNPLLRQIWFVQRWDQQKGRMIWAPQVSIDGLRCIAERTGLYDGQDEPEFVYDGKQLVAAKVRVYKKGTTRPFVGVAHFDEYAMKTKDGRVTKMWGEKPHIMVSKCAEALALRKAFPEDVAGLYVPEEMEQAPVDVTPSRRANHAPVTTLDEEPIEAAMERWLATLHEATTTAECDKVRKQVKSRLSDGDMRYAAIVDAYKARVKELRGVKPAPTVQDADVIERNPGEEG